MNPTGTPIAFLLVLLALASAACGPGEGPVTIEKTEKVTAVPRLPLTDDPAMRLRLPRQAPATAPQASGYAWTLPPGWEEIPPTQFRQGNFRITAAPELSAYLSVLPAAGGGVLANLNRWRRQMGLEPAAQADLEALPQLRVLGNQARLADLEGTFSGMRGGSPQEGWRMLGVLLTDGGKGVFLKMVGPKARVETEKDRFLGLALSLRKAAANPHAHGGMTAPPSQSRLTWKAPEGWVQGPARQMREVTYYVGGDRKAECYISLLPGLAGGLVANVGRWYRQMGQEPPGREAIQALPTVEVLDKKSTLVEVTGSFTGMSGGTREDFGLLGVICELGDVSVYVKMTAPAKVVAAERDNFLRFCESISR